MVDRAGTATAGKDSVTPDLATVAAALSQSAICVSGFRESGSNFGQERRNNEPSRIERQSEKIVQPAGMFDSQSLHHIYQLRSGECGRLQLIVRHIALKRR